MVVKFKRVLEMFSTLMVTEENDLLLLIDNQFYSVNDSVNLREFFDAEPTPIKDSIRGIPMKIDRFKITLSGKIGYSFSLTKWGFDYPHAGNELEILLPGSKNAMSVAELNTLNTLFAAECVNLFAHTYSVSCAPSNPMLEGPHIRKIAEPFPVIGLQISISFNVSVEESKLSPHEQLKLWFPNITFIDELIALNAISVGRKLKPDTVEHTPVEKPEVTEDQKRMIRAINYGKNYGTCDRLKVGAVLYKDDQLVGIGFNTSLGNKNTCNETGHLMIKGSCKKTIHAEMEALFDAIYNGHSIGDSVMYCSHKPCIDCIKMLDRSGVTKVFYNEDYDSSYDGLGLRIITERIIL